MSRLLSSLTAAAAVLADQAATRLDTWVENTTAADETPREAPLGFTPATGTDAPDPEAIINAAATRGLAGEQRDRWLAEVKMRLDLSTGGPWCTEEPDKPTGRIMSPYGVIATGVTREADRDLIEDARADLFGLLALAKHDDEVIKAWEGNAQSHAARRAEVERELEGMHHRERAVDMVAAAWVDGNLKGYRYGVDPDEPAGRVRAAIEGITASRGKTIRDLQAQIEGMHRDDALQDGTTSHLEVAAVMGAYDRGTALGDIDVREDSLAERVLAALIVERGRTADIEGKLDRYHRYDAEAVTDVDAVRTAAAARIRAAADDAEREQIAYNDPFPSDADIAGGDAYIAGLRAAADLAEDKTPEADPNVTHINTVNGRAEYTPGPFAEAILTNGGTIVVDDNGEPHVTEMTIGDDPAPKPGTLITADGKRHRFASGTLEPLADDKPSPRVVLSENGYVLNVIEDDIDE